MPTTFEHIASTSLTTSASSISFTSIPSTYTDLVIIGTLANADTIGTIYLDWRFNNDTGANYGRWVWGQSGGAITYDNRNGSRNRIEWDVLDIRPNLSYSFIANINDYANTTTYKNLFGISNNPGIDSTHGLNYAGGMWASTSAINRVDLLPNDPLKSWATGSTAALYGIKAG